MSALASPKAPPPMSLEVNGRFCGQIHPLWIRDAGKEEVLVPLRAVLQAAGWQLVFESGQSESGRSKASSDGTWVRAFAPYDLEYQREDLVPGLRGKRARPSIIFPMRQFLGAGEAIVTSPQMNVGENAYAKPLPRLNEGRLYVPLAFIEECLATLDGRIGAQRSTGVSMAMTPDGRKIQVRYIPSIRRRSDDAELRR